MLLSTKPGYRAEIDGLRAIAVLSVLGFHYGAPIVGGFTGVDIFFVISGFLITQILAAEIAEGRFSVLGFYDRRMRRILPALLVVLLVSLIAGAFLLLPGDYVALATSAACAAVGISNFFFLYNTGYFDQAAELMPLLHTWSLAVEEQFYVVWPLLLFALVAGRTRNEVTVKIAAIVAICCSASIVYFYIDPKAAFFLPLPRAWELGVGALLVFLPPLGNRVGNMATGIGLALIGVGFEVVSPTSFPGVSALYPCVGAALVVWPRVRKTFADRMLSLLAPIGLISYSLYLWHWPIWVYFQFYLNNATPSVGHVVSLVVASVAVAVLSFRYIEQPFRRSQSPASRTVSIGLACVIVVAGACLFIKGSDGLPERLPVEAQAERSRDVMWNWPCSSSFNLVPGIDCVFGAPWDGAKRKTMIWGDSHAEHFAPIIDAINSDPERSFVVFAGCAAVLGGNLNIAFMDGPQHTERCKVLQAAGLKLLKDDPAITQVILTSSWLDLPLRIGNGDVGKGLAAMRDELIKIIRNTSAPGREFILTGTVPELPRAFVECAHASSTKLLRKPCGTTLGAEEAAVAMQKSAAIDAMFAELAGILPNVIVVAPTNKLCSKDGCDVYLNGEFLYLDHGHIRRNLRLQTKKAFADKIGLTSALTRQLRDVETQPDEKMR